VLSHKNKPAAMSWGPHLHSFAFGSWLASQSREPL